jgi:hypothetical protein
MSYNGSGIFSVLSPQYPFIAGTTILAEDMNAVLADIASGMSLALLKDGTQLNGADQNWGGFGITNLSALTGKAAGVAVSSIFSLAGIAAGMPITNVSSLASIGAGAAVSGAWSFPANTTGVTAAVGTTGTKFATLDYVLNQAFSGTLPNQAGNAKKFLTTDSANASWTGDLTDSVVRIVDDVDPTKKLAFQVSGLTTATTRTLTVQDKDGTVATTADIGWKLLAPPTAITNVANLDFLTIFSSSYDNYRIVIDGMTVSGANDRLNLRFANAGVVDSGANYIAPVQTANNSFDIENVDPTAGTGASLIIEVLNANDTARLKAMIATGVFQHTTSGSPPPLSFVNKGWAYTAAAAISGFRLYFGSGHSFGATGKVSVYGLANS